MADERRDAVDAGGVRRLWDMATRQIGTLRPLLLAIYGLTIAGLAGLVVVHLISDIPLRVFFTDPVTEFSAPMYVGLVSNFGVVLWASAASVCLFGAWLLRNRPDAQEPAMFLASAGLLSTVLLFDDLYLLHEEIVPERLHIPQPLVLAGYALLVAWFLVRFRRLIEQTDFALLVLAGVWFAGSVLVDVLVTPEEFFIFGDFAGRDLIEDGLKLLGIVSWTVYLWRSATQTVRAAG